MPTVVGSPVPATATARLPAARSASAATTGTTAGGVGRAATVQTPAPKSSRKAPTPELLEPPVNVLRLGLHPRGLARRVLDVPQWRAHLLARLAREAHLTADAATAEALRS